MVAPFPAINSRNLVETRHLNLTWNLKLVMNQVKMKPPSKEIEDVLKTFIMYEFWINKRITDLNKLYLELCHLVVFFNFPSSPEHNIADFCTINGTIYPIYEKKCGQENAKLDQLVYSVIRHAFPLKQKKMEIPSTEK